MEEGQSRGIDGGRAVRHHYAAALLFLLLGALVAGGVPVLDAPGSDLEESGDSPDSARDVPTGKGDSRAVPAADNPHAASPDTRRLEADLPRGSLLDRHGLPLATSEPELIEAHEEALEELGLQADKVCPAPIDRCYPLGGMTWHLLGDVRARIRWESPRARFLEKELEPQLEGVAVATATLGQPMTNALMQRTPEMQDPQDDEEPEEPGEEVASHAGSSPPGEPGDAVADGAGGAGGAAGLEGTSGMSGPEGDETPSPVTAANVEAAKVGGQDGEPGGLKRAVDGFLRIFRPRERVGSPPAIERDVVLSIDARLQVALARLLARTIRDLRLERGAIVVLDPVTGEMLAVVNHPWPEEIGPPLRRVWRGEPLFYDRARFVLKPPASTFKLVTAMAALRRDPGLEQSTYACVKLGRKRVGCRLEGHDRPIRDDEMDRTPHGQVDMRHGIEYSCNAYFAQLGARSVQARPLLETAGLFGIPLARPNTVAEVEKALPQTAYGQGEVLATPLQMATVAATIANDGRLVPPTLLAAPEDTSPPEGLEVVTAGQARMLAEAMRKVTVSGTARSAFAEADVAPIAGKTGTAEVKNEKSHAWFVGFAPWSQPLDDRPPAPGTRIAFAVMLENAGYGGLFAAPLAAEVVRTAESLGIIARPEPPPEPDRPE